MSDNSISILDGSTFLVSSPNGDIDARPDEPQDLFFQDTRHLSKWKLTVNGVTPRCTVHGLPRVLLRSARLCSTHGHDLQEPNAFHCPSPFCRQRLRAWPFSTMATKRR